MKKTICIPGGIIEYTLEKSLGSRKISLCVCKDAHVVVRAPYFVNIASVENFIREKADWIIKKIDFFTKQVTFLPRANYRDVKNEVEIFVQDRVNYFNQFYNFNYNRICIRNHKSKWGSCSNKGNLNFNYRILFLPPNLADYIIVHEMCHLGEMNHSAKFWQLVAKVVPEHKKHRRELKRISF